MTYLDKTDPFPANHLDGQSTTRSTKKTYTNETFSLSWITILLFPIWCLIALINWRSDPSKSYSEHLFPWADKKVEKCPNRAPHYKEEPPLISRKRDSGATSSTPLITKPLRKRAASEIGATKKLLPLFTPRKTATRSVQAPPPKQEKAPLPPEPLPNQLVGKVTFLGATISQFTEGHYAKSACSCIAAETMIQLLREGVERFIDPETGGGNNQLFIKLIHNGMVTYRAIIEDIRKREQKLSDMMPDDTHIEIRGEYDHLAFEEGPEEHYTSTLTCYAPVEKLVVNTINYASLKDEASAFSYFGALTDRLQRSVEKLGQPVGAILTIGGETLTITCHPNSHTRGVFFVVGDSHGMKYYKEGRTFPFALAVVSSNTPSDDAALFLFNLKRHNYLAGNDPAETIWSAYKLQN